VKALGKASTRKAARQQLEAMGSAATGRLIRHLNGSSSLMRVMSLSALQTCWDKEALDPVVKALSDRNKTVRGLAHSVLRLNLSAAELSVVMSKLADNQSVLIAGPALESADRDSPDVERMARALARSGMWKFLDRALPRYHSPTLTAGTRSMLDRAMVAQKITAVCGLMHQQDGSPKTRAKVAKRLRLGLPRLREMAAEYMLRHGTKGEIPALEAALKGERDVYCQAAMRAAIEAIGKRAELFKDAGSAPAVKWSNDPARAYREAMDLLKKHPTVQARDAALKLLASAEPFEPVCRLKSGTNRLIGSTTNRNIARADLLRLVTGYPALSHGFGYSRPARGPAATQPAAMKLMGPVRDYFDPKRKSFGLLVASGKSPFGGTHHVGDDVQWHRPNVAVVAIGDGRVRAASAGVPTWGGIVIIEHTGDKDGPFCSLYGHLDPLICVTPGQKVKRGQKVGSLGRAYTWSNGGYGAHLHFGIRKGPFRTGAFSGYLPPSIFKSGASGWIDPQPFIRARLK